jgi:hypothetical protein
MKLLLATLLLLAPLGCGSGPSATRPASPDPGLGTPAAQPDEAAIYAAVVRRLVTKDHTFGGAKPPFQAIYVVDGAVRGAADPERPVNLGPQKAFSDAVKLDMQRRLSGLPPVRFIAARDAVVVGERGGASPGHVRKDGMVISLGPIVERGTRVEVANSLWMNGLVGQWLTYVLVQREERWTVSGTTGQMAIS